MRSSRAPLSPGCCPVLSDTKTTAGESVDNRKTHNPPAAGSLCSGVRYKLKQPKALISNGLDFGGHYHLLYRTFGEAVSVSSLFCRIRRTNAVQAVSASLREWHSQMMFSPKMCGKTNTRIGKQITLRLKEIVKAFAVHRVDCQNEIIRILYPARKNAQKYHILFSAVKAINSVSPGLKIEKKYLENGTIKR